MHIDIKTCLYDILGAIDEIDSFFINKQKFFVDFQNDIKTKRAVERNLEIIGEAMSRIKRKFPDFIIFSDRKIIDTRNRIAHGYDTVSDDVIWGIVIKHLPILKKEIENLLNE